MKSIQPKSIAGLRKAGSSRATLVQRQRSLVTVLLLGFPLLLWRRGPGRGGHLLAPPRSFVERRPFPFRCRAAAWRGGRLYPSFPVALLAALCAWAVASTAYAQRMPVASEVQAYALNTGICANSSTNEVVAYQSVIQAAGKPSKVRLHFGAFNLGKRSYLTLTSTRDGGKQKLDRL